MYIIGSPDAVRGFALVGVRGQAVATVEELARALDRALADKSLSIVLVTTDVADLDRERVDRLIVRSASPLVVEIPGPRSADADRASVQEIIRRTIGIKV